MTDYSKTKIYKIESHLGDKIYIGSTCKQYLDNLPRLMVSSGNKAIYFE